MYFAMYANEQHGFLPPQNPSFIRAINASAHDYFDLHYTKGGGGKTAAPDGKQIFTANCASCHTLKAAGATGTVGPNLDAAKPSESKVETQVTNGGGVMPAFKGTLTPAEIKAVAKFVSENAGK